MISKDAEVILKKASEVPPLEWLPLCLTNDQHEHWQTTYQIYFCLHAELHSYFSGNESPLREWLLPDWAEVIELQAQIYIDLYAFLREGWSLIKAGTEKINLNPNLDKSQLRAVELILSASSPGHLLALIIEMDCKYHFEQCLTYNEFRPRKIHEFINLHQKVEYLKSLERDLAKPEVRKIADYQRTIEKIAKPLRHGGSLIVIGICSTICLEYLKRHTKSKLKTLLKQYQMSQAEMIAIQKSKLHPSKKLKAHSWINGLITPL